MAKLTLSDLASLTNETSAIATINANHTLIEAALENTVSRDGTVPNTMSADLDLNSNHIINLAAADSNGMAVRYEEFIAFQATITDEVAAAASSAGAAATSATEASASASSAAGSATAAAASVVSAAALLDTFDDVYLGSKSAAPTVDNDGDPLNAGDLYFNNVSNSFNVYDGVAWGAIATSTTIETFLNKTIDLSGNTLSGTTAEFNTALSDDDFATLTNAVTLTNKTVNLTSNTLTGTTAQFNTALSDNSFATLAGTETLTNKTLTAPVISTISNTGTVTLPTATDTLVGKDTTDTLTNKTINLTSNTLSGTTAQFNTALSDNSFATLAAAETLTNKTVDLGSNILTGSIAEFDAALQSDTFVYTSEVGSVVQAWDTQLDDIAALAVTDSNFIVGDGLNWVVESGNTARASLGLATGNAVQFFTVDIGHATDTTLSRASAGVVALEGVAIPTISSTNTLTNKTVDLTNNTVTGTTAEFNTALSDDDFATLTNTVTLTNKTLTAPVISTISNTGTVTLPTATTTLVGKDTTDTLTNKTLNLTSNTLTGTTAQFNTALSDGSFAISGGAFHDGFSDFVADEHIAHSGVTLTAGNGLTGGGTIAANRTFTVGAGTGITVNANDIDVSTNSRTATITFVFNGGGSAISTGVQGYLEVPFACDIQQATLMADVSGSIVVDVWKDTYANYPPTNADSITASAPPTITTATKSQDATLTGWTTSIAAGDILGFNVDSATTVTLVTLSLEVLKSS